MNKWPHGDIMKLQTCYGVSPMIRVGVRELKNNLSLYLRRVKGGEWIEVTNRGKVIAILIPAKGGEVDERLLALVKEGMASWSGGKPRGASRPVKGRGRPLSELIIEDRR